ncbi:MAG: hypothetical protein R3F34_12390 [Planctomycetota bacterium]
MPLPLLRIGELRHEFEPELAPYAAVEVLADVAEQPLATLARARQRAHGDAPDLGAPTDRPVERTEHAFERARAADARERREELAGGLVRVARTRVAEGVEHGEVLDDPTLERVRHLLAPDVRAQSARDRPAVVGPVAAELEQSPTDGVVEGSAREERERRDRLLVGERPPVATHRVVRARGVRRVRESAEHRVRERAAPVEDGDERVDGALVAVARGDDPGLDELVLDRGLLRAFAVGHDECRVQPSTSGPRTSSARTTSASLASRTSARNTSSPPAPSAARSSTLASG